MKYASDNRFVHAIYTLTTGRFKPLFIAAVVALVLVSVYFPVRDFYIAQRTQEILEQQLAIRSAYNKKMTKETDKLLSKEGVQDAARKKLGMVEPGEKTITVKGLDADGNPVQTQADGSDGASGSAQDSRTATDAAQGADAAGGSGATDDKGSAPAAAATGTVNETGGTARDDGAPTTSGEVEDAERAVMEDSPWYWKVLDTIFFFTGANGQAVVSTGDGA